MSCQGNNNKGGEKSPDIEKSIAEIMYDPRVQQAYLTEQMAKAFETAASGGEKNAHEKSAKAHEVHHTQPAEQPNMPASIFIDAPVYGDITARQQSYDEVAAYADPSYGNADGNSEDKLNRESQKLQSNLEKWEGKTEHLTNKLQKVEMKSQVQAEKDLKNFHSFTFYSDENGRIGVTHNVERMTKDQHETKRSRGILHKLDARFSAENIGVVYVGKSKTGNGLELRSKDIPKPLKKARHFAYKGTLTAETAVLKTKDAFQHTLFDTGKNLAFNKVRNELYRAGQENEALKAVTVTAGTAFSAAMGLKRWNTRHKDYFRQTKGIKLENKQTRLKNKIEKFEMKSAAAKEIALTKALADISKENGLDIKFTRAEKKKAWKKVYDGTKGDGYLKKPKSKLKDGDSQSGGERTSIDKRIDKLGKREYKNAKKLYATKLVKVERVNTVTGRKEISYKRVVDTSQKKRKKPKRPNSLPLMIVGGGAKKLGNKIMLEMATDDNASVRAMGKGLQFFASELPRSKQRAAQKSKLRFEKKQAKAEMKLDSARSEKLMLEKERANGKTKPLSKKERKKAQKKSIRKKRNSAAFKERAKQAMKKAKEKAVSAAKNFFVSKAKFIAIGVVGAIILMLLPIMLVGMVGGGGGGGVTGGIVGAASYTADRKGLIDFNNDFNALMWQWQNSINDKMNSLSAEDTAEWELVLNSCSGGPIAGCEHVTGSDYVEDPENVYKVIKTLYGGDGGSISQYDITCLYAYFTVKYKDKNWASVYDELGNFFANNFELLSKEDDTPCDIDETRTLDMHVTVNCGDNAHTASAEPHEVDVKKRIKYYYLYTKEGGYSNIQDYINDQLKGIGEMDKSGKTEGELHYEYLLESLGLHQVIDYPAIDAATGETVDWSYTGRMFGTVGELYDVNANSEEQGVLTDYRYRQKNIDDLKITSSEKLECVAGAKGKIIAKTGDTVVIEYPDEKLKITYSCGSLISEMTALSVGSPVESGTHLFCCNTLTSMLGDVPPTIEISAHDTELNEDINPLLVIQSKIH